MKSLTILIRRGKQPSAVATEDAERCDHPPLDVAVRSERVPIVADPLDVSGELIVEKRLRIGPVDADHRAPGLEPGPTIQNDAAQAGDGAGACAGDPAAGKAAAASTAAPTGDQEDARGQRYNGFREYFHDSFSSSA